VSEDCHNSDNGSTWTPEQFDAWKKAQAFEMLKAANLLRQSACKPSPRGGIRSTGMRCKPVHLGRWEELTIEDFKFLYDCGVSCE